MFGTNDIDGRWNPEKWKEMYKIFIRGFIDLGVIPVISTIPPELAHINDKRCEKANEKIIEIAEELKIPYVDYYSAIKYHQPGKVSGCQRPYRPRTKGHHVGPHHPGAAK